MNETAAKDMHDVQPSRIEHLIGNEIVKQQVQVALDASFEDRLRFPDTLILGPPGIGKSSWANVIARELDTNIHQTIGQTITGPAELNALLIKAEDGELIHIDEVHELPRKQQTALFVCLDQRVLMVANQRGGLFIPLNDFTLLLSTTDPHRILAPLRDRMRMNVELSYLAVDELTQVVEQRASALNWNIAPEIPSEIAKRGRGTPRKALNLLQSARRVSRSERCSLTSMCHLEKACEIDRIDCEGLTFIEQQYLHLLGEGPTRLNVLASCLGMPNLTVCDVIEPYLLRSGFIIKDTDCSRTLIQKGMDHLSNLRQQSSKIM